MGGLDQCIKRGVEAVLAAPVGFVVGFGGHELDQLFEVVCTGQQDTAAGVGDEVYGADPRLRAAVRGHRLAYVLAAAAHRRVPTHAGPIRVDALPALIPAHAWQTHSAGAGAHGPRLYSWAWFRLLAEDHADPGVHHLLIRRNDRTGEHTYLRCYSPKPVPLRTLVAVAGQRWRIEESFQAAKGLVGLDQHQVRRWRSWHRWTTLAMLAHAFLAVACAIERDAQHTRRV